MTFTVCEQTAPCRLSELLASLSLTAPYLSAGCSFPACLWWQRDCWGWGMRCDDICGNVTCAYSASGHDLTERQPQRHKASHWSIIYTSGNLDTANCPKPKKKKKTNKKLKSREWSNILRPLPGMDGDALVKTKHHRRVINHFCPGDRWRRFNSQLGYLLAVSSWASHLASLFLLLLMENNSSPCLTGSLWR